MSFAVHLDLGNFLRGTQTQIPFSLFGFDLGLDFGPGLGLGLVNCKVYSEVPKGVQRDRMLCV